jgi:hypothetical protein
MVKQETVERWAAEAGVPLDSVKFQAGAPVVWRACWRCGGTGYLNCFGHVDGGRCFRCHTAKGEWVSLKGIAARERARPRKAARAKAKALAAAAQATRDARSFLASHPGLGAALRSDRKFHLLRSFANQLARKGELSDRQVEVAFEVAAKVAARPAEAPEVAVPSGRQVVEGKVVSVKEHDSPFGLQLKMLVKVETAAGAYKVYGTVPRCIDEVEGGELVKFNATLEPKETGFGFFSRPMKAAVVEAS